MLLQFEDIDEYSQIGKEIIKIINKYIDKYSYKIYSDEILQTSCPECGDNEFWNMYDKECSHCGYGRY